MRLASFEYTGATNEVGLAIGREDVEIPIAIHVGGDQRHDPSGLE